MADRKATNKYYPPEYFDEYLEKGGKGGINAFRGQHPLRERAKKLQDGILRIRFEMPFNIWCNGCNNHIGKGVRYNADKKKVGMYYSTPIWNFRMKCHLCDNYIEIQTDPQARDYTVIAGGKRKVEEWEAADAETVDLTNVGTIEGVSGGLDPFASLEKEIVQKKEAEEGKKRLLSLIDNRESRFKDDYGASQLLRKRFRTEKKTIGEREVADKEVKKRLSLSLRLATPAQEDTDIARAAMQSRTVKRKTAHTSSGSRSALPQKPPLNEAAARAQKTLDKLREKGVKVSHLRKSAPTLDRNAPPRSATMSYLKPMIASKQDQEYGKKGR